MAVLNGSAINDELHEILLYDTCINGVHQMRVL